MSQAYPKSGLPLDMLWLVLPAKIGMTQDFLSPFFSLGHAEKPDTKLQWVIATYFA